MAPTHRGARQLLAGLALGCCATAAAEPWAVVPETSSVIMYATSQGAWFNGVFESFTATIDLDTERPAAGSIAGIVETDSFKTEDTQKESYVKGYLDVGTYPEARFESTSIERTEQGYRAVGELTLVGVTKPATLEFTFATVPEASVPAGQARLEGLMTINRFDFGIANDVDVDRAGQDVTVQITLDLKH